MSSSNSPRAGKEWRDWILIADEHPGDRGHLVAVLESAGHALIEAGDWAEALARLSERAPALLLINPWMARLDGFEFVRQICRVPGIAATRLILYAAANRALELERIAHALGAAAHLIEPVAPAALLACISRALHAPPSPAMAEPILKMLAAHHRLMADALSARTARLNDEITEYRQVAARLRESRQSFAGIVESAMDAIISIDAEQRIVLFNAAAEAMFRCPAATVLRQPLACLIPERLRATHALHVRSFFGDGSSTRRMGMLVPLRGLRADGEEFRLEASLSRVATDNGALATVIVRDISQRVAIESALAASEAQLRTLADSAPVILWLSDAEGRATFISRAWSEFTGQAERQGMGRGWLQAVHPDDRKALAADLRSAYRSRADFECEFRVRHTNGSFRWVLDVGRPRFAADGPFLGFVGSIIDITERKVAEEFVRTTALHDPLTGLPNRALIFEYGSHLLAAAERNRGGAALLFIDLDRFKPINDRHGHVTGDQVLREVARRLTRCTRQADLVGRLGGDEFVILLSRRDPTSHRETVVAQHLLQCLREPIRIGPLELAVTPSIGISHYPEHARDMDSLLHAADLAMYQAKQKGRAQYHVYTSTLNRHAEEAMVLETRLRSALRTGGFQLHYQPVIDLRSGRLVAAEALLRLGGQDGGLISPLQFIPVAESAGLIGELGEWVAMEACRQHEQWLREGLPPLTLAINVSPLQFKLRGFAEQLGGIVATSGIDPARLQLEVAESAVMERVDEVIDILRRIRSFGIRVALADLGTGYSSLNLLGSLPLDTLKIDQAFVRRIERDAASLAVTRAIIALGHTLRLVVVGEGVESENAMHALRDAGCHHAQGFLISRPLSAEAFAEWRGQHAQ